MAGVRLAIACAVAAMATTIFMARKDPTDHYAALGLDRRASKDEIRAAYKQAALRFHPDKCASKRGLWHALLGGAARCARRFHAASAAEEVLSDDAKRIEYDVELARLEFERNARRQHRAYGGGGLLPEWFRPGLLVYYLFVACLCLVIWTYALEPVLRGAKRAVEPKQTAADRSAARMAAVRRQQEALSAAPRRSPAPRRPAPAGRPPAPDATAPPPRRRPVPASAPTPGLLPPLLQPPAARRPPDAAAERESAADESRRVRSETDEAYAQSLADDQRKAAQRAAADAEAAHEQAIRDRREAARQLLAATPEATGPTVKPVRVRLPEGPPLARTFSYLDPISLVRAFVDASGRAPENFSLVYLGPPIATLDDDDAPLSSLGPGPVTLMVTDLDA